MKKLKPKQVEALKWLVANDGKWVAPWWGGRPHAGWPKQMPPQTYNALSLAKLVKTFSGSWAEKTVAITIDGRKALEGQP